jgi:hypothetical protein
VAQSRVRLVHLAGHDPESANRLLLPEPLERIEIMYSDPGTNMEVTRRSMTIDDDMFNMNWGAIDRPFDLADERGHR